jgi:hypothetical protein
MLPGTVDLGGVMRGTHPLVRSFAVTLVVAGLTTVGGVGAGAPGHRSRLAVGAPMQASQRGTAVTGLRLAGRSSPCADVGFEIRIGGKVQGCTHGPDPAPAGVDPTAQRSLSELRASTGVSATGRTVPCVSDGTTGNRVQAVYAHLSNKPDHFSTVAPLIRIWAAQANEAYNASAAETQGSRQIRFVTSNSTNCVLKVLDKSVPSTAGSNFTTEINSLMNQGLKATNRKYLIWTDATSYCGLGEVFADSSASLSNRNNKGPQYASVEKGCWGQLGNPLSVGPTSVEAHELTHALGAVQANAPRHTSAGHCTDEWDAMCYRDASATHPKFICPIQHSAFLDCGHNDYFSTKPPSGTYLATHWNAAKNSFLVKDIAPGNDDFASATPLAATAGIYVASNRLATAETGEQPTAGQNASHSIWYSLKATANRRLTVDTQGTKFDTVAGIYTGSAVNNLNLLAENDDVASHTYSRAAGDVTAGITYFIKVDGKAGAIGPTILHVSLTPTGVDAPVITDINKNSGASGTSLKITGTGFTSFAGSMAFVVAVDGFSATINFSTITDTNIDVTLPSNVNDPSTTAINSGATGPVLFVGATGSPVAAVVVALSDETFKFT